MKKTMVIGLGPDYNYPVDNHSLWDQDNTKYASNHGASLISRTLMDFFDADYIDDFSDVEALKITYDLCVISFATHITSWRDVSRYTDFIKKLNIKTVAFSLGIQDYAASSSGVFKLHPSILDLLNFVIKSSGLVGVRGPETASTLLKAGISSKNIVRIGCPTMFRKLDRGLKIEKNAGFKKSVLVFHRTLANLNKDLVENTVVLGQDFLDEVIFTKAENNPVHNIEMNHFKSSKNGSYYLDNIEETGFFSRDYNDWYERISSADFVYGPRLHGCITGITSGIPSVMIARDIRVTEIAKFFKIPYLRYEDVHDKTPKEIYDEASFEDFNFLYPHRFDNFIKLLSDLDILDSLQTDKKLEVPKEYYFTKDDLNAFDEILFKELSEVQSFIGKYEDSIQSSAKLSKAFLKFPGVSLLKRFFR